MPDQPSGLRLVVGCHLVPMCKAQGGESRRPRGLRLRPSAGRRGLLHWPSLSAVSLAWRHCRDSRRE
eukprot:9915896-Heterocapsa_arctica.AAC.1